MKVKEKEKEKEGEKEEWLVVEMVEAGGELRELLSTMLCLWSSSLDNGECRIGSRRRRRRGRGRAVTGGGNGRSQS